jgi:hypothetical protein
LTEDDRKHVGEALRTLCAVHRVPFNTNVVKGYWEGLKTMSRADFDYALQYLTENSEWMPKPASFRSAAKRGWQ